MKLLLILIVALGVATAAVGQAFGTDTLRILQPSARPTPPGAKTGAVYLVVQNVGITGDRIVGVASPVAATAEMHTTSMDGTVMRMRAVKAFDVPARGKLALAPGGSHIMLVDLKRQLSAGETVPLTLTFEKAGPVEVVANVEAAGSATRHSH